MMAYTKDFIFSHRETVLKLAFSLILYFKISNSIEIYSQNPKIGFQNQTTFPHNFEDKQSKKLSHYNNILTIISFL